MKPFLALLMLCALVFAPAVRADDEGVEDRFVTIYGTILAADTAAQNGKTADALSKYAEAQTKLKKLREEYPTWNVKVVKYRLEYLASKLEGAPAKPAPAPTPAPRGAAPGTTASAEVPAKSVEPGEPVAMKLNWQVGKRYSQRVETSQTSEISLPNQPQPMKQEQKSTQEIALSVLKAREGGGRELEMEIVSMTMDISMGGRSMLSFDSSKPPGQADAANPAESTFRKMVGARIKYMTDASGKVESVQNFQEFLNRLSEGNPTVAETMKSAFSEQSVKEMASLNQGLPEASVKVGDTWPVKSEVALGPMGTMVTDLKYTFKGWERHDNRQCAVLEYTGTMSSKPASDGSTAGAMTFDRGNMTGKTWYDPALGMVMDSIGNQDIAIRVNAEGQSMNTQMRQIAKSKMVSVTDIPK